MNEVRIGIVGCGHAARIHLGRLAATEGVRVVGCADTNEEKARLFAESAPRGDGDEPIPAFADHAEMLRRVAPDAVSIFTPHLAHYRPTIDALQAGCHVFIERPLSTNVQEAADVVNVARARGRKVAVGHQFRLLPGLREARQRLLDGAIGPVRLAVATLAGPWLSAHRGEEHSWRFDPKVAGGGLLADAGSHLIDALLWCLRQPAVEASAFQGRPEGGPDLVTAAAVRLGDGTPATLGLAGDTPGSLFELVFFGERGRLRVDEQRLSQEVAGGGVDVVLPAGPAGSIDADFAAAIRADAPPCCPAEEALATVRLIEAIGRSAATGQVVRLG